MSFNIFRSTLAFGVILGAVVGAVPACEDVCDLSCPAEGLAAYLSGMLIGHEIRAMADLFPRPRPIRLVADGTLAARYAAAFTHLGRAFEAIDVEAATLRGLTRLLERAGPLA